MSSLLLVLYTYVGEVSPRSRGDDQDESKAIQAKSQTARGHLEKASARAEHNRNAGHMGKRGLGRTPQTKCLCKHEPSATIQGRAGVEKCSACWTRSQALNPKWHVGKQVRRVVKAIVMSNSQIISKQLGENLLHPTTHT